MDLKKLQINIKNNKRQIEDQSGYIDEQYANLLGKINQAESDLISAKTDLKEIKRDLVFIKTDLDKFETGLGSLESNLDITRSGLGMVVTNLNNTKTEVTTLQTDLNSVKTELQTAGNNLNAASAEIQTLKTELNTIKSDINTIESSFNSLSSTITNEIKNNSMVPSSTITWQSLTVNTESGATYTAPYNGYFFLSLQSNTSYVSNYNITNRTSGNIAFAVSSYPGRTYVGFVPCRKGDIIDYVYDNKPNNIWQASFVKGGEN